MIDLSKKSVVIIGAEGNIGPTWVRGFLNQGCVVFPMGPENRMGQSSASFPADSESLRSYRCDVTDRTSLERVAEQCFGALGAPDVLVVNAGVDHPPQHASATSRQPDAVMSKVLEVNVLGLLQVLRVFGERMAANGRGSIVLLGSMYGTVSPDPSLYSHMQPAFEKPAVYGASKAAVVQICRHFAVLWGNKGVRVNVLSPGGVASKKQDKTFQRKFKKKVPLGRMATAEDLLGPMMFLASDQSRYVTGHNLIVDGGFTSL